MSWNPISGQYEDKSKPTPSYTGKKRKFNPITGQWEDEDLQQSIIGGLQQHIDLGAIPQQGTPLKPEVDKAGLFDLLSVGQYSSAKFADTLVKGGGPIKALADATNELGKVVTSFVKPGESQTQEDIPERVSYKDVLKDISPDFVKNYPIASSIIGFVGDVALDPTTYLTFGTGTGARIAGKNLTNKGIDLVRNLNKIAEDGFQYTIKNAQGLERIGVIGIDELAQLKNIKDLQTLTRGAIDGDKAALGQLNTIINAQTKGFKGKLTEVLELSSKQSRASVEDNFFNLARTDPNLIMKGGDTGVFLRIPFSPKRITLVPPEVIDTVIDHIPGLKQLRNDIIPKLKESDTIAVLSRESPYKGVSLADQESYKELRATMYGQENIVDHSLMTSIQDISRLPAESRQKIGDIAIRMQQRIEDALETKRDVFGKMNPLATPQDIENVSLSDKYVTTARREILNKALRNKEINIDEYNAIGKFIESHNRLAEQSVVANMFKHVNDKDIFFGPEELKALKATDLDLAVAQALKIKAVGYAQAQKQFDDGISLLFSTPSGKLDIPPSVQRDIDFIGTSIHSKYQNNANEYKAINNILTGIGKFNDVFKPLAYAFRPAAATKQYVGNTLQGFVKIGLPAFKTLDPRSIIDAAIMVIDNSAYSKYIPTKLLENVRQFGTPAGKLIYAIDRFQPDLAKDFVLIDRLGFKTKGPELAQELMINNIYNKGFSMLSLDQTRNLRLEIAKQNGWSAFQKEKWKEGYWTFAKESIPWINLPSYVENINRTALYINAKRMGMDAKQSTQMVKDALFDYAHGTTAFENKVMKRIIPFYTFQRFALPLIGSLVKEPGRAASLKKITQEFFDVYQKYETGDKLTDAETKVLPGFILEQPHAFAGMTKDGQIDKGIFRTFNSMMFTDWLSLIHSNSDGSINWPATVKKMGLAQITPILKVPFMELPMGTNFFTNRPISTQGKISSNEAVQFYDKWLPEQVKDLIRYKVDVNPRTGEKVGYINPYYAYLMTSFAPFLTDYINIPKGNLNPREAAMKLLAGIGTIKLDFQSEKNSRVMELQKEREKLAGELRKSMYTLNVSRAQNDSQQELQRIIKRITEQQNELNQLNQKLTQTANLKL